MRLLLVDDDPGLRELLRTTFEIFDLELDEADSAAMAARRISACKPDVIVLDVLMPGIDGLEYTRALRSAPQTRDIPIVLLTGSELADLHGSRADALIKKPFSPLELLSVVERLAGGMNGVPLRPPRSVDSEEQLLLYASDLRHLLEIERQQRSLLNAAYHDTVAALAGALESKDTGTRAHSQRVQLYAVELAGVCAPELLNDPSIEYGFLLHDLGKIGIPDQVLQKPAPLSVAERRLIETHTVLGEQMLEGVSVMSPFARTTSAGTETGTQTASSATRSRSARACSRSRMRWTRSRAIGRTAGSNRGRTPWTRLPTSPGSNSTRRLSTHSASATSHCARFAQKLRSPEH